MTNTTKQFKQTEWATTAWVRLCAAARRKSVLPSVGKVYRYFARMMAHACARKNFLISKRKSVQQSLHCRAHGEFSLFKNCVMWITYNENIWILCYKNWTNCICLFMWSFLRSLIPHNTKEYPRKGVNRSNYVMHISKGFFWF